MSDPNNEASQEAQNQGDLNALPESERAETKAILDEIAEANKPPAPPTPPPPPAKPAEPRSDTPPSSDIPPKDGKPAEKPPEAKPGEKIEDRRDVSLMPVWQHKIAEKDWQKKEKELTEKIETLSKNPPPPPASNSPVPSKTTDPALQEIADEAGMSVETLQRLVDLASKNHGKLPEEVSQKLAEIDRIKAEREREVELSKFSSDFERLVLPEIKREYGDDVPAEVVSKIKDQIQGLAYTPEYSKVPYTVIYKGVQEFRGVIPPKTRGAEPSRGGYAGSQSDAPAPKAYEELTSDEVQKLSDDEFEKYSNYMAEYEKRKK